MLTAEDRKKIYLAQIYAVLPKVLASFNTDPTSKLYGCADRLRWAWKLSDFANATPSGVAHGLSILLHEKCLPAWLNEESALRYIAMCFAGVENIRRPDGSWEEAFPYEGSYCVTALISYNLLATIELISPKISSGKRECYLSIIKPAIKFLLTADETHAFISNHLATAVAALILWHKLTGENSLSKGKQICEKILAHQSAEGWFNEYGGADPGYQSLGTGYLAEVDRLMPEWKLRPHLERSVDFIAYACHPDGSFGGYYGSRNTRFWYPAGFEYLAEKHDISCSVCAQLAESIQKHHVVTLDTMDDGNLAPMFNMYCIAVLNSRLTVKKENFATLPAFGNNKFYKLFAEAGILFVKGENYYTVISIAKSGVVQHYPLGNSAVIDTGIAKRKGCKWYSSQSIPYKYKIDEIRDEVSFECHLTEMHRQWPSPIEMSVLHLMAATVMRWTPLRELIKKILVKILITGTKNIKSKNKRTIHLGNRLCISDESLDSNVKFDQTISGIPFSAIHMASCGYWQLQDNNFMESKHINMENKK